MDRLTIKSDVTNGYSLKELCQFNREGSISDECSCEEYCANHSARCEDCAIQRAFNKLAEYEEQQKAMKPVGSDNDLCPKCFTYNKIIPKRIKTVGSDVVYCWHCGQALQIGYQEGDG